jgi:hypothetical protein
MLYVVPRLGLTVVMTSNENAPSSRTGHRDDLHALLGDIVEAISDVEQRDRPRALPAAAPQTDK